ncbi:MAG: HDIG domain-containing protein [Fibrobacterales bacterium]
MKNKSINSPRTIHLGLSFLIVCFIGCLLFPVQNIDIKSVIPKVNELAQKHYVAPLTFDIPKSEDQLIREREGAADAVPAVFEYDTEQNNRLKSSFTDLIEYLTQYQVIQKELERFSGTKKADSIALIAATHYQKLNKSISHVAISQMSTNEQARSDLIQSFRNIINKGISNSLIAMNKKQVRNYKATFTIRDLKVLIYTKPTINLIQDSNEESVPLSDIKTKEILIDDEFVKLKSKYPKSQAIQSAFYEILFAFTSPTILYLESETQKRRELARTGVDLYEGKIYKGMDILRPGDLVTSYHVNVLKELKRQTEQTQENYKSYLPLIGRWLLIIISTLFLGAYFILYQKHEIKTNTQIHALATVMIIQFCLFFGTQLIIDFLKIARPDVLIDTTETMYLHLIIVASILGVLLFSVKTGFILSIYFSLYYGMMCGYDLNMTIVALALGMTTAYALQNIRYRWQFITTCFLSIFIYSLLIITLSLLGNNFNNVYIKMAYGALSVTLSIGLGSFLLLPIFEKLFKITTTMTLIELSDFNHPALKLISTEVPSTFHHSIMVANIAEKAASAINANSLLVRVMALYHDIGKTQKPLYYTENQGMAKNVHEGLDPWESKDIIISHVTEGITLAEKYQLPPLIISSIPEHHGTTVIQYFYRKAVKDNPGKAIKSKDFCHLGPKPQSKETAILMIADTLEAMARSISNPETKDFKEIINQAVDMKLKENQMDDSGLTLSELPLMKKAFLASLEGMYHTRLNYAKD